jgi:hypothetical protein
MDHTGAGAWKEENMTAADSVHPGIESSINWEAVCAQAILILRRSRARWVGNHNKANVSDDKITLATLIRFPEWQASVGSLFAYILNPCQKESPFASGWGGIAQQRTQAAELRGSRTRVTGERCPAEQVLQAHRFSDHCCCCRCCCAVPAARLRKA